MENEFPSIKEQIGNLLFLIRTLFGVNKKIFVVRIPLLLLQTVSQILSIWFMKLILNEIAGNVEVSRIVFLAGCMAISGFLVSFVSRIIMSLDQRESLKVEYRLKTLLADKMMRLPYIYAVEPQTLNFLDMASKENSFSTVLSSVSGFIGSVISAVTYSAVVITVHPLIMVLLVLSIILDSVVLRLKTKNEFKRENETIPAFRKMWAIFNVLDFEEYGKEVRVNRLKNWITAKGMKEHKNLLDVEKKATKTDQVYSVIQDISGNILTAATYLILSLLLIFRNLMIGDFTFALNSMMGLSGNIKAVISGWNSLLEHGLFSRGFKYIMNLSDTYRSEADTCAEHSLDDIKEYSIEFRHVTFTYPGCDTPALSDITFRLDPGETLSLVGVNGAGKTTLVMLLCRFYEPDEGEILVGGIPIKNLPFDDYYRIFGVAFQDSRIFTGTIAENITYGKELSESELERGLRISGLLEKVNSFRNGVRTTLGREFDEDGVDLSGGEKQKLSISRVFCANPEIMIFDEPTSALDPIAEHEVISGLQSVTQNKTSIIISHRLSSTKMSDKIAVMADGMLQEYGNHNELIKKENGIYHQLFEAQAKYYK